MASKKTVSPAKSSAKGKVYPASKPAKPAKSSGPAAGDKPRAPATVAHTPRRFDGKVVVTTGAAAGLGRATVLRLALEGATQVLVDLKKDGLKRVQKEIEALNPRAKTLLVTADVSNPDDVHAYVKKTMKAFGRIDGFFNNAGIEGRQNLTEDFGETDLAATAGMTPSAFSRSFRRHTGMGVVEYVNRLRINLACQMLMNDAGKTVTDICYAVGFNNLSNFNRQFLRRKGMPPSRFRALHEDNSTLAA